jgi:hypothetical protein
MLPRPGLDRVVDLGFVPDASVVARDARILGEIGAADTFEPCRSRTMPALANSGTIDSIRLKMPSTMATSTTWPAPPFTSR